MSNLKVKLSETLARQGLGFVDPLTGEDIRQKKPGKQEVLTVTDSVFVQQKLRSKELVKVATTEPKKAPPPAKTGAGTTEPVAPSADTENSDTAGKAKPVKK